MSEFERFALALAWTESNNNAEAWGDHGLAMGRWQVHPAWYAEWADPAIQVGWSWDQAVRAALRRFCDGTLGRGISVLGTAMIFHLGARAVARGEWDKDYEARFKKFWDAQTSENKA